MLNRKAFYSAVGRKVKLAREQRHLTQEQLASQLSLSRTSITNVERGRQQLMLHTLLEISIALSIAPVSLLPPLPLADNLEEKLKGLSASKKRWIKNTIESSKRTRKAKENDYES